LVASKVQADRFHSVDHYHLRSVTLWHCQLGQC